MGRSWDFRSIDQTASSAIRASSSRTAVCPERAIWRPDATGRGPTLKSSNSPPVCVPLPAQRTTTISRSAIKGPVLWNSRSGKASRKSVMKRLKATRPRRKLCIEYCKRTSGAANSSTIARSGQSPQNEANHRPTIALFNVSLSIKNHLTASLLTEPPRITKMQCNSSRRTPVLALVR
jgi:hypothetical protein